MHILKLEAENFKRLSVVQITPEGRVVEVSGPNASGKTSVLDAIEAALGGKDASPERAIRTGAKTARSIVTIGDEKGVQLTVERRWTEKEKSGYLIVKGAEGGVRSTPQKVLNDLVGRIALDPLEFSRMKPDKQAEVLRGLVKFEEDLDALDGQRDGLYNKRTEAGRELVHVKSREAAIVVPAGLPDAVPDIKAITDRLADAGNVNEARGRRLRAVEDAETEVRECSERIDELAAELAEERTRHLGLIKACEEQHAQPIPDPVDTAAVRAELDAANIVAIGIQKRAEKIVATASVTGFERLVAELTEQIEAIDQRKADALAGAKMPVEGLGFGDGMVTFNGVPFSQASAAEQLRISAAIAAAANPKLGVLLVRDGSLMDSKSLAALATFAEEKNLQVWVERVDEGAETGIIMVDGHVKGQEALVAEQAAKTPDEAEPAGDAAERHREAIDYLTGQHARLKQVLTVGDADTLNAEVKVRLEGRKDLIAKMWTPEYLAVAKRLSAKRK